MTTQRLDTIDQRIALVDSIHEVREAIRQQGEVLSSGIAALTEQVTEFRADMAQFVTKFRADTAEFRADMADIKATTQRQAETADRLSRIVELLLEELRQR